MDDDDTLRPSEVARQRRRDRDASSAERAGMRTGLAKTMKQVMDAQVRRGAEARRALEDGSSPPLGRPSAGRRALEDGGGPARRRAGPDDESGASTGRTDGPPRPRPDADASD